MSETGRRAAARRAIVGRRGEEAVARWYAVRGYELIESNWRCPEGEIDLVLRGEGGRTVVFCEVKTRTSSSFGSPWEAVDAAKARRLRRLAGRWMAQARPPGRGPQAVRVDVAAVRPGPGGRAVVEVVEGAC